MFSQCYCSGLERGYHSCALLCFKMGQSLDAAFHAVSCPVCQFSTEKSSMPSRHSYAMLIDNIKKLLLVVGGYLDSLSR